MNITRIKAPKYKVGRYSLNEYELRCLMSEVAEGKKQAGIIVKDEKGNKVEIEKTGRLSGNLFGLDIATSFSLILFKYRNKTN